MDLDGDTLVVGHLRDFTSPALSTGSVMFFERAPNHPAGWVRSAFFHSKPPGHLGLFGTPAVSGDRAAVTTWAKSHLGGRVEFFRREGATWKRAGKDKPNDLEWDDEWGYALDMDGRHLIIGSPKDDDHCPSVVQCNSGSAYAYSYGPNGWEERGKIYPSDPGEWRAFGGSVAMEGDLCVIGSLSGLSAYSGGWPGAAFVFRHIPGQGWVEEAKLMASDDTQNGWFALNLALSGNRVAVCAYLMDGTRGAVYVFERDPSGVWTETAKVQPNDLQPGDQFGVDVDLDGDRMLVGANTNPEFGAQAGAGYLFEFNGTDWKQTAKFAGSETAPQSFCGWTVELEGATAALAAPYVLWNYGWGEVNVFDVPTEVHPYCVRPPCPCGAPDPNAGCLNTLGQGGALFASGTTSVAADDLVLEANGLVPGGFAQLWMSDNPNVVPFYDGALCLGSSVAFLGLRKVRSDGTALWSDLVADVLATQSPTWHLQPGMTTYLQALYRDPGQTSCSSLNLTTAVRVDWKP